MNFFTAQDKARKKTTRLVFLFILAIVFLILLTNLFILMFIAYVQTEQVIVTYQGLKEFFELDVFLAVSFGVFSLVFIGSLYKTLLLSKGGKTVAEMLGGKLVSQNVTSPKERKLLNVVEEMAIASGVPVPRVYLLDEISINAFAAGNNYSNAVIGVTRGAIDQLSRSELQGVIAHEFSHILNGDMKMNIRLIGTLHGILLIGMIGEYMLRSMRYSGRSRSRKNNGGALILLALGLLIIGYAGTFFGGLIKSAVSRQREYLADASAVQFTRDKDSIAGALKKVGGNASGSIISHPNASEYSHAYFSEGVDSFFQLFHTHPPLDKRIKAIDPGWDGKYLLPEVKDDEAEQTDKKASADVITGAMTTAAVLMSANEMISHVGSMNENNVLTAKKQLAAIPDEMLEFARDPYTSRTIIFSILIFYQDNHKEKLFSLFKTRVEKSLSDSAAIALASLDKMDQSLFFPLLEIAVNSMRELSQQQYEEFKVIVTAIINADKKVTVKEWIVERTVFQILDEYFSLRKPAKARHAYLGAVKKEAQDVMTITSYYGNNDETLAKKSFEAGVKEIGASAFKMSDINTLTIESLNQSLDALMQLKPLLKPKILKAIAAIIVNDKQVTPVENDLFRAIALCLDCPAPPLSV